MKRSTIFICLGIAAVVIAAALLYFSRRKKKAATAAAASGTPMPSTPGVITLPPYIPSTGTPDPGTVSTGSSVPSPIGIPVPSGPVNTGIVGPASSGKSFAGILSDSVLETQERPITVTESFFPTIMRF